MSTNSQFLYTFTDEFSTSEWVDWTEGVLATPPKPKFQNKIGFQRALGTTKSGPRTRASEAYRSGYLRAPLVDSRFTKAHAMPLGWLAVINGKAPQSTLGYFAYIIGRALRDDKDSTLYKSALNDLAAVQILHIGFERDDRWFSTVALFEYVRAEFQGQVGRDATDDELLYLAAALVNTVEGPKFDQFLATYTSNAALTDMNFTLANGTVLPVKIADIPAMAASKSFDLNSNRKRMRAHRYWAKPERGIYSRAANSKGREFLREFAEAERARYIAGEQSAMSGIYETIAVGDVADDIFELAPELFSEYPDLLTEWQSLNSHLASATRSTIKSADFEKSPGPWKLAQQALFGKGGVLVTDKELSDLQPKDDKAAAKAGKKEKKAKAKKKLDLPSSSDIEKMVAEVEDLFVPPPHAKKKVAKKKKAGQQIYSGADRADQDRRNSNLGQSGEEFIYKAEKHKLRALGLDELADKVTWVSKEIGDGLGWDITSYDEEGDKLLIEVKTTSGGAGTPFYISANELEVSQENGNSYKIFRLYDYPKAPKVYVIDGPLDDALDLTATSYRATPK